MPDYCPEQLPAGLPREPDASTESIDDLGMASRKAATVPLEAGGHDTCIEAIPAPYEARFELRQPIPVDFEEVERGAVIARFSEADLAVTGDDRQDATAGLASWILDIFDDLRRRTHRLSAGLPPCSSAYWGGTSSTALAVPDGGGSAGKRRLGASVTRPGTASRR